MREAPRSARCARLHQDVRGDRLVEQQHELARGALLERCDQVEGDFDADHRSAGKQLPARVAQAGKPSADDGLHALGDPKGLACAVGRPAKASFIGEQPDEFADEQRIPLGLAMDRLGETVGRTLRGGKLDVARHLMHGQSRRIEALRGRHAGDFGEQADPWVSGGQLTLAIDGQHHDAGVGQVHGHEPEQQQRRLVGGVEVVEDQDDGTVARRVPQQARERVEQLEAGAIGVVVLQAGQLGEDVADLRQDLREMRSVRSDEPAKVVRLDVPQEGAHRLEPRPVDRRAARFPASPPGHTGTVVPRFGRERVREARLADAGLARQQHQATAAPRRACECGTQRGHLPLAAEQRFAVAAQRRRRTPKVAPLDHVTSSHKSTVPSEAYVMTVGRVRRAARRAPRRPAGPSFGQRHVSSGRVPFRAGFEMLPLKRKHRALLRSFGRSEDCHSATSWRPRQRQTAGSACREGRVPAIVPLHRKHPRGARKGMWSPEGATRYPEQ